MVWGSLEYTYGILVGMGTASLAWYIHHKAMLAWRAIIDEQVILPIDETITMLSDGSEACFWVDRFNFVMVADRVHFVIQRASPPRRSRNQQYLRAKRPPDKCCMPETSMIEVIRYTEPSTL